MRSYLKKEKEKEEKKAHETKDVKTTRKSAGNANTVTHSTRCKALRIQIKGNSRLGRRSTQASQLDEGITG